MKAIRARYENGEIKPLEPMPDIESAEVIVVFPDGPGQREGTSPPLSEEELFGSGKDWWTDEVDAAVRASWAVRTRPWKDPGEDPNAPL